MKRKIFFASLLALLLLAGAALAAETIPPIKDTYEIDGITYYNVNSQNFDSTKKFYEDVLSAKHSSLGGRSLAELWMILAVGLDNTNFDLALPNRSAAREATKQAALKGPGQGTISYNGGYYAYTYVGPTWNNDGYVQTALVVLNPTAPYQIIMRFSDFGVGVILPDNTNHYVSTVIENDTPKGERASTTKNDTNNTVSVSQSLSKTVAESLTSAIEHSFSYSFTEGVSMGFETEVNAGVSKFKLSGEFSFEASQTISDGWSESKGTEKSDTFDSGVNVTLPPYTTAMLKQGESNATMTTKYNCPVFVSYKVTIYIRGGYGMFDLTRSFGSNARADLYKRAFVDVNYDEQSIKWNTVLSDSDYKNAAQKLSTHLPMSSTGATMVYTNHTIYNEISTIAALHPLAAVDLGNCNVSFIDNDAKKATMKVGNYSYTNYLNVDGYNSRGGAYYGFNENYGRWVVVGEDGQELPASSAPVVIEQSSVSGQTKFKAVRPGNCFLKYLIDENCYPSALGSNSYTKNSALSRTALLEVEVLEDEITYEIDGSYWGRVNGSAESLEGDDKLEIHAYNSTGREVEASHRWEARELKGISLQDNGIVTFTKPGNFHVRVANSSGSIYSAWKEITAEVLGDDEDYEDDTPIALTKTADADTSFIISGNYIGGLSSDAELIEGDGKLTVTAYDSTGQEEPVAYTWEAQNSDGITLTDNGIVSFTKTGAYYVRVKSGEFYSDWFEITAREKAPAIITHAPSASNNPYNGTEQELLNGDARFEGVRMLYGLGENETTAPNEYSSEIPTATNAGTYYVWYKVQGDEKHENSEPQVVKATILASSSGDDDGKKDDDEPKETVGSKGGGCNSLGFGVEIFAAAALFMLKRKSS